MATLRFRSAAGTIRITNVNLHTTTVAQLKQRIAAEHGIPAESSSLKLEPNAAEPVKDGVVLASLGLVHGALLYLDSPVALKLAPQVKKTVDADGNVVVAAQKAEVEGFRPGVAALRSQKLHWTLTEMTELDDQYTFIIKGKEPLFCANVSMDITSAQGFQAYLRNFAFKRPRIGHLYGRFVSTVKAGDGPASAAPGGRKYGETKGTMRVSHFNADDDAKPKMAAVVDAIYEPRQDVDANGNARLLPDPLLERADRIAGAFELRRVGIIFSYPPGREGYHFSAQECITSGMCALDATEGARDSPFVAVAVTLNAQGVAEMDAYQLTKTCLDMVAEDALLVMPSRPGFAAVDQKFSAVVEAKAAEVIDTDFLIKRVPILSHTSPVTSSSFPRLNRDLQGPTLPALQKALAKTPRTKALLDFDLLMYLAERLDIDTVCQIARALRPAAYEGVKPEALDFPEGFDLMVTEVLR